MRDYVNSMVQDYEKLRGKFKERKCAAKPGQHLKKHEGDPMDQPQFRTIVGKVLYAQQKNIPTISNAVRALTSHLVNPGPDH